MSKWLLAGLIWFLLVAFSDRTTTFAAELVSTLDLVTDDAAFCLEVPHLEESWARLESGPVMDRLRQFPPFQRLLESQGFRHWQAVEEHVARLTGSRLSSQLRALFGKSLVLAIYVPPTGEPRGILIGEAIDAAAIQTAMATWSKLEPNGVVSNKLHHGQMYFQRKRDSNAKESGFIAISDRWFAISDHESMVQNCIDRFLSLSGANSGAPDSLSQSPSFVQNRGRLTTDGIAYVHINARPWDRGLEESSQGSNDPIKIADLWKHVKAVSACLRIDRGIVCESVIELDPARLTDDWSRFVTTAASESAWMPRIANDSLFAVTGRLEIAPLIRLALNQIPAHDKAELFKVRRIAQSLFGGHDVLDTVLPALTRDFGGYVTTRPTEHRDRIALDGMIGFTLDSPSDIGLLPDVDRGLDSGLSLLAAYFSVESRDVVTVNRSQNDEIRIRSLSETSPLAVAYGLKGSNLVIAGSESRLRQTLASLDQASRYPRLAEHSKRLFDGMNQLIWLDAARTRTVLQEKGSDLARGFAHGSADEATRISRRFEQVCPFLELVDSVFVAGRIESDHVRIVFGGGLDSVGFGNGE